VARHDIKKFIFNGAQLITSKQRRITGAFFMMVTRGKTPVKNLMGINIVKKIDDKVMVNHVLISVSEKTGLDDFIPKLLTACPNVKLFSTGGTYSHIKNILGGIDSSRLIQVSDYTGQPETQGGLVKTLDFKIYLGLLTETYNDAHQSDLKRTNAHPIDMVVVNLYPFRETIAKAEVTPEMARGNIDIGGPCMIRASAKNYIRVASVVDPADYTIIIDELASTGGKTTLKSRFYLAQKAFQHTAAYDTAIALYIGKQTINDIRKCYPDIQ
jgi:phosphoribosylaminoimidazolecarboxamide formyltransferase / IMP cyclohydrolase